MKTVTFLGSALEIQFKELNSMWKKKRGKKF